MRKVYENFLNKEDISFLLRNKKRKKLKEEKPEIINRIINHISKDFDFEIKNESYYVVETHKIGHKWHKDTGTDNHMSWCQVGLSVLLTSRFTGGLMYYADDGSGKNKTLVKRKVGDLCVHDSSEWHMVEPHEGKRTVLLIFI